MQFTSLTLNDDHIEGTGRRVSCIVGKHVGDESRTGGKRRQGCVAPRLKCHGSTVVRGGRLYPVDRGAGGADGYLDENIVGAVYHRGDVINCVQRDGEER